MASVVPFSIFAVCPCASSCVFYLLFASEGWVVCCEDSPLLLSILLRTHHHYDSLTTFALQYCADFASYYDMIHAGCCAAVFVVCLDVAILTASVCLVVRVYMLIIWFVRSNLHTILNSRNFIVVSDWRMPSLHGMYLWNALFQADIAYVLDYYFFLAALKNMFLMEKWLCCTTISRMRGVLFF